ncbi:MAG: AraC family transcriptional regulator [Pyrinomonadaceae bacterium]
MDGRIFRIIEIISQSMGQPWTVSKMADLVQVSVPHFQSLFKMAAGKTPMQYLHTLRLEKTHEVLSDPLCFLQINEVAGQVGLSNESHFARDFKEMFGRTPTQFRNEVREQYQRKDRKEQKSDS